MSRQIVITGLGAVTGHGIGFQPLWEGLVAGRTSIARLTRLDPTGLNCKFGSEAKDFSAKEFVPKAYRKFLKVMARDTELAVAAARKAVEDAGLVTRFHLADDPTLKTTYPTERTGCNIGAGLIAAETLELTSALATSRLTEPPAEIAQSRNGFSHKAWGTAGEAEDGRSVGGMNNLPPLWMLKYLPNMLACHVSIVHGTEGPSNTITCAEASGLLSIGESARIIERDAADVSLAGSAESKISLMGVLRLDLAGRLSHADESSDPAAIVRPFDPTAAGNVPGEAGGILILEELTGARRRGAKIYAEIVGFGAGHSASRCIPPLGAPSPGDTNEGLECAILAALNDAQISPDSIDAIVPQGSGIAAIDHQEASVLRRIFGTRLGSIPLITLTPAIGDSSAGSGAVQMAVAAKSIAEQRLPARIHGGRRPDDLDAGATPSRAAQLRHVLVCSGALGGQNAALVLRSLV